MNKEILDLLREGELSYHQIGKRFGMPGSKVGYWAKVLGLPNKHSLIDKRERARARKDEVISLYIEGVPLLDIAKKVGISAHYVRDLINEEKKKSPIDVRKYLTGRL